LACIKIFGLNLRDQLVDDRWNACLAVEALWARLRHSPSERTETLKKLAAIHSGKMPFTASQTAKLRELAEQEGIPTGPDK
jgi:hypothetical protein